MGEKFRSRVRQHDVALSKIIQRFRENGFQCYRAGSERLHFPGFQHALRLASDRVSYMLRFLPDLAVICERQRKTWLAELKTSAPWHQRFSVEIDSFRAALSWDFGDQTVFLIGGSVQDEQFSACWIYDVPPPKVIYVPTRPEWEQTAERLRQEWPLAELKTTEWRGGGGTPYFFIEKGEKFWLPLQDFIAGLRSCKA